MPRRDIRYQAAILDEHQVLLLRVALPGGKTFWLPPGGGREEGESEEACVCREVFEETALTVQVERLLLFDDALPEDVYETLKTYLCRAQSGTAAPGVEPEWEATLEELRWFDLRDPASWPALLVADALTLGWMERIRAALGYA